jgi:predicted transposase/invertase (TIGR01784 family)
LQERIFQRVFDLAEIARFDPDEARIYEESLKHYRDMNNTIASAERRGEDRGHIKGREEGREEKKREIALNMKADGMTVELIAKYTGLTAEEIAAL